MVSAWPEPPSAKLAEPSAGVCDGQEVLALCTSEANEHKDASCAPLDCASWGPMHSIAEAGTARIGTK